MKRRTLAISLSALPLVAACASAVATPTAVPAPVTPKPKGTYYFLAANNADPFYGPGVKGFKDACAAAGYAGEFVGPMDLSVAENTRIFEQLNASSETAGIFLYPLDPGAQAPLMKEARTKHIPLVVGAADMLGRERDAFVGYNPTILGVQAADWIIRLTGGKGKVGSIGLNKPQIADRWAGFYPYLKATAPGITTVEASTHDGSAENEVKTLDAYLAANKDLTAIYWADGAGGNLVAPWKERQQAGVKTLFLASDMPDSILKAVKDGVFVGSVGQDTYTEAYWSVLCLDNIKQGRRVPDTLYLSAILVDKSNVGKYLTS